MKKIIFLVALLLSGIYLLINIQNISFLSDNIPESVKTQLNKINDKIDDIEIIKDESSDIVAYVNINADSNIVAVFKAKNGEWLVVFADEKKVIDKIVFITKDDKKWIINLNKKWQPTNLIFEWTIVTFTNYTDKTVDISVNRKDWTTEIFKNSAITDNKFSFIATTMAFSISEYFWWVWTAMNVVSCWVWLWSILFTWWASSPLAYMWCAALATRIVTLSIDAWHCEWDVLDCAKNAYLEAVWNVVWEHGPSFLKKWFKLKWTIKNSVTDKVLWNWVLKAENKSFRKNIRWNWEEKNYNYYFKDPGVYNATAMKEWFADSHFDVIFSSTKAQFRIPGKDFAIENKFEGKDYSEMNIDLFIDPDAFIRWEIIDIETADSIKDAKIFILDWKEVVAENFTESNGEFVIQPPLNDEEKEFILKITAEGYTTINKNILITYEVKEDSDEYELEDWNWIIKMKKWVNIIQFILSNPEKENGMCNINFINMLNRNTMNFTVDDKWKLINSKDKWFYIYNWILENNQLDLKVESKWFSSEQKSQTVVHLIWNLNLNNKKSIWTWSKPSYDKHNNWCKWTWTIEGEK